VSQFHWENLKVQKLAESKEGHENLSLIKEVLQFYSMDYTLNIFNSEANLKEEIKREELSTKNNLKGKVQDDKPVLFHIFQQFMKGAGIKPSKPESKDKDQKKNTGASEQKGATAAGNTLATEKEAIGKAQEVIKKNEIKTEQISKIPDLPVQKRAPPKEE
jgi:hypothetical protein